MRSSRAALALVLAGFLILAPAALAAKVKIYAPPGKAGTSEYSEIVPSAGGNTQPPAMGGGNATAAQMSKLGSGKQGVTKLSKLGKQGAAAAQFAQATAPVVVHSTHGLGGPAGATGSARLGGATSGSASGSALSGIGDLLGGSDAGGIGPFLPLLLAFGLGWAAALGLLRARRGRDADGSRP